MARALPHADIIAMDLVIPPETDDAPPPNIRFIRQNADDQEWAPFKSDHFDFIYARMITSGIHDWPTFRAKCYRYLKPGGLLELSDLSHPMRAETSRFDCAEASPLINFVRLAGASWRQDGLDYNVTEKHVAGLTAAGFVDVKEETFHWPIGTWPEDDRERKMGEIAQENVSRFLSLAGKSILMNGGFMSEDEAEKSVQAAKEDLLQINEKKLYYLMYALSSV